MIITTAIAYMAVISGFLSPKPNLPHATIVADLPGANLTSLDSGGFGSQVPALVPYVYPVDSTQTLETPVPLVVNQETSLRMHLESCRSSERDSAYLHNVTHGPGPLWPDSSLSSLAVEELLVYGKTPFIPKNVKKATDKSAELITPGELQNTVAIDKEWKLVLSAHIETFFRAIDEVINRSVSRLFSTATGAHVNWHLLEFTKEGSRIIHMLVSECMQLVVGFMANIVSYISDAVAMPSLSMEAIHNMILNFLIWSTTTCISTGTYGPLYLSTFCLNWLMCLIGSGSVTQPSKSAKAITRKKLRRRMCKANKKAKNQEIRILSPVPKSSIKTAKLHNGKAEADMQKTSSSIATRHSATQTYSPRVTSTQYNAKGNCERTVISVIAKASMNDAHVTNSLSSSFSSNGDVSIGCSVYDSNATLVMSEVSLDFGDDKSSSETPSSDVELSHAPLLFVLPSANDDINAVIEIGKTDSTHIPILDYTVGLASNSVVTSSSITHSPKSIFYGPTLPPHAASAMTSSRPCYVTILVLSQVYQLLVTPTLGIIKQSLRIIDVQVPLPVTCLFTWDTTSKSYLDPGNAQLLLMPWIEQITIFSPARRDPLFQFPRQFVLPTSLPSVSPPPQSHSPIRKEPGEFHWRSDQELQAQEGRSNLPIDSKSDNVVDAEEDEEWLHLPAVPKVYTFSAFHWQARR